MYYDRNRYIDRIPCVSLVIMSEQLRSITIKTGIVRRLAKELNMYREEEKQEKEKVQKMKESGADPYDIKYAVGCCGLSYCNISFP